MRIVSSDVDHMISPESVMYSLDEAILVFDRSFRVVLLNRAAEEILGRGLRGITHRRFDELFGNAEGVALMVKKTLNDGRSYNAKEVDLDIGRSLNADITLSPLYIENSLRAAILTLKENTALPARDDYQFDSLLYMLGSLAHEIKNPLSGIKGAAQLLRRVATDQERAYLAYYGQRVLIVDLDPQANATSSLKIDKNTVRGGTYESLIRSSTLSQHILHNPRLKLSLLPSSPALAGAEVELVNELARETRLKKALEPILDRYDYILIDCPPNLPLVTQNSLAASDYYIITTIPDHLSTIGINILIRKISELNNVLLQKYRIARIGAACVALKGILFTMVHKAGPHIVSMNKKIMQDIHDEHGDVCFENYISWGIGYTEAAAQSTPVSSWMMIAPYALRSNTKR